MEVYLLNRFLYLLNSSNKTLKKILEKSGKFVSPKLVARRPPEIAQAIQFWLLVFQVDYQEI